MKRCANCDNPMPDEAWRNTDCCCSLCYVGWARAELERLQAIVDQLPKTIDGVPVLPGMVLWYVSFSLASRVEVVSLDDLGSDWPATVRKAISASDSSGSTFRWHVQGCYSSREAAEAAR